MEPSCCDSLVQQSGRDARAPRWRERRPELILALLFLLTCGLIDLRGFNPVEIDSHSYINAARGLLATGAFALPPEEGAAGLRYIYYRTPGFPVVLAPVLALFGDPGLRIMVWMQRLLWAAFVVFALPATRPPHFREASRRRLALTAPVAGKALALFLPLVLTAVSAILTEVLYTVLTYFGLWLIARLAEKPSWRGAALAGVLLGTATMVRPVGVWMPAVAGVTLVLFQLFRRRPIPAGPLALAVGLALLSPLLWSARNLATSGHFFLCSIDGPTFGLHRVEAIRRLPPDVVTAMPPEQQAFVEEVRQHGDVYWAQARIQKRLGLDEFTSSRIAFAVARTATLHFPMHYARAVVRNLANIFISPADSLALAALVTGNQSLTTLPLGEALRGGAWGVAALHLFVRGGHLVLLVLVPALLVFLYWPTARREPMFWILTASSAYLILGPVALTVTYGRFLFPVIPALAWCYGLPARTGAER